MFFPVEQRKYIKSDGSCPWIAVILWGFSPIFHSFYKIFL